MTFGDHVMDSVVQTSNIASLFGLTPTQARVTDVNHIYAHDLETCMGCLKLFCDTCSRCNKRLHQHGDLRALDINVRICMSCCRRFDVRCATTRKENASADEKENYCDDCHMPKIPPLGPTARYLNSLADKCAANDNFNSAGRVTRSKCTGPCKTKTLNADPGEAETDIQFRDGSSPNRLEVLASYFQSIYQPSSPIYDEMEHDCAVVEHGEIEPLFDLGDRVCLTDGHHILGSSTVATSYSVVGRYQERRADDTDSESESGDDQGTDAADDHDDDERGSHIRAGWYYRLAIGDGAKMSSGGAMLWMVGEGDITWYAEHRLVLELEDDSEDQVEVGHDLTEQTAISNDSLREWKWKWDVSRGYSLSRSR